MGSSGVEIREKRINEFEDKTIEFIQSEQRKIYKIYKKHFRDLRNNARSSTCIIRTRGERREGMEELKAYVNK